VSSRATMEFDNEKSMETFIMPHGLNFIVDKGEMTVEEYEDNKLLRSYEYFDQTRSVEHNPGITVFHGLRPGAKIKINLTKLAAKSFEDIKYDNDDAKIKFRADARNLILNCTTQGLIHEIDNEVGHNVRKCYVALNGIAGDGGARILYTGYVADRNRNIGHVYLLFTHSKKEQATLTNAQIKNIVKIVNELDLRYKGI
jgi:hypothetical protein